MTLPFPLNHTRFHLNALFDRTRILTFPVFWENKRILNSKPFTVIQRDAEDLIEMGYCPHCLRFAFLGQPLAFATFERRMGEKNLLPHLTHQRRGDLLLIVSIRQIVLRIQL